MVMSQFQETQLLPVSFFQLHLVERFRTGIKRINVAYRENEKKLYILFSMI